MLKRLSVAGLRILLLCCLHNFSHSQDLSKKEGPTVIVSTLDGKVSALDVNNGGTLKWSVDIGQGPLVSSSISKLHITQDGKVLRLIPSLTGRIYKFDGSSVEAVPFSADELLSSSFKISDDAILVGGKEITAFALESTTGRLLYICTSAGCHTVAEAAPESAVVVLKRRQQTVRSVESRSGHENWNFTVGEVELDVDEVNNLYMLEHSGEGVNEETSEFTGFHHGTDSHNAKTDEEKNAVQSFLQKVQVLVPEGVFCVFNAHEKTKLFWKHKFKSPIANAWYVHNGKQQKINLFDTNNTPALQGKGVKDNSPALYLGIYESHIYIQTSPVAEAAEQRFLKQLAQLPRFPQKFPQKLKFTFPDHPELPSGRARGGDIAVYDKSNTRKIPTTTLPMDIENQKGIGFYLRHDIPYHGVLHGSKKHGRVTVEVDGNDSYGAEVVYSSFMHWWKEIFILTVTTSIFMQFLIVKFMRYLKGTDSDVFTTTSDTLSTYADAVTGLKPDMVDASTNFDSRFLQDFEPMQCLGKGGFGVVFESRNKVDDCTYAVKRIRLPNKIEAREKVMREVRALAKLEHPCIVRYFNAWMEEPPQGWQEEKDKELISGVSEYPSHTQGPTNRAGDGQPGTSNISQISQPYMNKQSLGCAGDSQSFSIHFQDLSRHPGESTGYDTQFDQEGKFFRGQGSDVSSEETSEDEGDQNQTIPFARYAGDDDSSGVVFEREGGDPGHFSSVNHSLTIGDTGALRRNDVKRTDAKCIRRRASNKLSSVDSGTGSELRSVVCTNNDASKGDKKSKDSESKLRPTVYLYIQMQLCQKDSLRIWLANSRERNNQYCLWIFRQVTSAVDYVHDQNLIHRDLKPSNIFFAFDGSVKVGDFGLVTHTDDNAGDSSSPAAIDKFWRSQAVDLHTEQVGTRLYMAPEQMTSRTYCKKVDIFALGIIFIEMLVPFGTQMERVRELNNARKCKIDKRFMEEYPDETTLIKSMLSNKPSKRPSASDIFSHALFSKIENNAYEKNAAV